MAEILTAKNGAVGTITMSNPTKMNAMSVQMWTDLPKAIRAFDADPEVRVIVIAGVGDKAFVSGADISQFDKLRSSAKTQDDYDNAVADSMVAPVECSKPVIGKIRGFCFGGGLGLAAACDIRICSEDATFRMPAARLGLGYGHKGIKRFTDIIGLAENAPLTVAASKFNIRQVCAHPDEQDMDRAVQMVKNCFASEDFKEGRTAFMEKRPAQFKGR